MNLALYRNLHKAIALLQSGNLVAVPTETVYGLAADAMNEKAVQSIFTLKGRPNTRPLSLLISKQADLSRWAIEIPEDAYRLAKEFWPGPLTLILKKNNLVPDVVTAGGDTIGLRSPDHPLTQAILDQIQNGLAAPSANRFGEEPPVSAEEVLAIFKDQVPLVVDGGTCQVGLASTILDLTQTPYRILRQGALSKERLASFLGCSI